MANKKRKYFNVSDEQQEKLKKDALASIIRSTARPRTVRDLGITALKNLPANITMVQGLMRAVNWSQAQQEVLDGLNSTVVIVGQPNSGKSSLFNKMKGQMISPVSPHSGTTRTLVRADFGPFTLVATPGHLPAVMESGLDTARVIVFLIDASKGLQPQDRDLYETIKKLDKPTIVAVNKVDALKGGEAGDQLATEVAVLLDTFGVIPISAKTGENIAEELIPAIIDSSPEAALAIGRELPTYRRDAAQRIIRNAALLGLAAGIEPIPFIDIPILLGIQVRLVLRLAALYGEKIDSADAMLHARELIATLASGLGLRLLAEQAAKAVPFGGDFVAGVIAGAATWSIGEVALEYYESDKQIDARRLRQLYRLVYKRVRKEKHVEEWSKGSSLETEDTEAVSLLDTSQEKTAEEGTA